MNDKSVSLTAKDILDKIFTPNVKGYDPDEVDDFLDQIVRDYQAYDKYIQDAQAYIQSLETQLRRAKEDNHEQSISLAKAENRVKGIKDTDQVNSRPRQNMAYRVGCFKKKGKLHEKQNQYPHENYVAAHFPRYRTACLFSGHGCTRRVGEGRANLLR